MRIQGFESFVGPFVIMLTVPLGVIGALAANISARLPFHGPLVDQTTRAFLETTLGAVPEMLQTAYGALTDGLDVRLRVDGLAAVARDARLLGRRRGSR